VKKSVSLFSYGEKERYRLLVDAITDYAIYMLDRDGNIVSWNTGASRFKGYAAEEIIGKNFATFYTEEDRRLDLPRIALGNAAAHGRYEAEGWRVRKDGSRFWVNAVIDAIKSPDGDVIGFAKITRDLTERRKAEEALRRSQELFRLLVESVTDYAIFMIDADGFVATWNAGAQRIKGYAAEEIIGKHFSVFYPEEDRNALEPQRALNTALRDGRFEKEGFRLRKDGTRFWANVVIDPVRNEQGELIGFTKITRDITERREVQRTLETTRETLFQSQKLEAIGQLTGGVAHDFNNLLMVVLSSLGLIEKRVGEDADLHRLIENARCSTDPAYVVLRAPPRA
jgi:PAS domain S-box-containing protein